MKIGIDIGGSHIAVALVSEKGEIVSKIEEDLVKKENIEKIPKDLPLYLVAGSDDPVGNFGKSVENVAKTYRECGIKDVSLKLYEKDRHEILNELDRQTVYEDILAWVEAHLI